MKKTFANIFKNQIVILLSTPSYLYFALSVFFSQIAFNMLNVVLIFLIFYLTNSNFAVSLLLFAILVPQIILSFFGGVVADASNKKTILVLGNILRAGVVLILFLNWESPLLVYVVTLIISCITQFYVPAESPLIPTLVAKDKLVAANSIFGISLFGSILIGYVIAGPAISVLGRSNVFLLITTIFVLAGVTAAMISPKASIKAESKFLGSRKSIKEEFKNSLSLLAKTRRVADAFFLLIFSQVVIFILATLIPGYAKSVLEIPAEDISIIIFAPVAFGMVLAGIGIGSLFNRAPKDKLMTIGIYTSGLVLVLLPFMSNILSRGIIVSINTFLPKILSLNIFNFVLVLAFLAGFANALIFIPSQAIIQEIIPEDFRSKIYGLLFALIGVFSIIPIMIAGGIADIIGVGAVLFIIGLLVLILGIFRQKFVGKTWEFL